MQIFFTLKEGFETYIKSGKKYNFPSPEIRRCHNCNKPVHFKKHGFYQRYLVTIDYSGLIVIRRYICPLCGCTISYIPDVCMPGFVFSTELIFQALYAYFKLIRNTAKELSRQLIRYYRVRLISKTAAISAALRQILPNARLPDKSLSGKEKSRMVLLLIKSSEININDISHRFYDISGKAILQKNVTL
ncbi:MAG: hypothetical protein BWY74_02824 [Firmicutes bacterium ADurb.Bin419]|nr:MAG: hypothetical protein BWY74_02824 [Firmicutes bacterium ADurb.Bin419]